MSFSGYVLNGEQDRFYYMSLSRLHQQRLSADKKLCENTPSPLHQTIHCSAGVQVEEMIQGGDTETQAMAADSEVILLCHSGVQTRHC